MRTPILTLIAGGAVIIASNLHAETVIFYDDFESGLTQWSGASAIVAPDPLGSDSNVLTFTGQSTSGDLFTASAISVERFDSIKVQFDYLGQAVPASSPGNFGGFLGFTTNPANIGNLGAWIAGTFLSAVNGLGFAGIEIADDGVWHSYEVDISEPLKDHSITSFFLMLEDWADAGGIGAGVSGDVFFDNIRVIGIAKAEPPPSPSIHIQRKIEFQRQRLSKLRRVLRLAQRIKAPEQRARKVKAISREVAKTKRVIRRLKRL